MPDGHLLPCGLRSRERACAGATCRPASTARGSEPDGAERLRYEAAPALPIDSPVIVTDMIMDGNLGQPFMSRYVITFDLAGGRLWLAKGV